MLKRIVSLVVPGLLVVGCGITEPSTEDQTPLGDGEYCTENCEEPPPPPPERAIEAPIFIISPVCEAAVAQFETEVRYTDDGSLVTDPVCTWQFDDGTTASTCTGEHTFVDGGFHDFVLEVEDPATGAFARTIQRRFIDPPIEANLDVRTDDLTISWNATTNVGIVRITVEPVENLIIDDPSYVRQRAFTMRVREAGTYTVTMHVEDERSVGPICSEQIEQVVTVTCAGTDHDGHVH